MIYLYYTVGLLAMWIFCDGIASLWAYWHDPKQTFWRDHFLRVVRMLIGIALMVLGGIMIGRLV